jgi:serine/threonine protein phosphatase PrpC/predicted Ser/Thr protein kinase
MSLPMPHALMAALPVALRVSLGQHSERGRKGVNQDFHGACIPAQPALHTKGIVAALADGVGSSDVSHEASEAAVRAVLDDYYCTSDAWSVKRSMQRVLAAMNSWLHAQTQRSAHRHDHDRGWVCALSAIVLKGRSAHLFHCGDIRIYKLADQQMEQLTNDHRVGVGGGISYLSRALGFRPVLEIDYRCLPVEPGDLFLLACDGVHEHVAPAVMAQIIHAHGEDLDAAARAIVRRAFDAGSGDNLTVQLVRVDGVPEPDAPEALQLREGLALPPLLQPRSIFDGWRIERELHGSSRSHVYLATDLATGEAVALKTPSIDLAQDSEYLDRLALEEWIARRIHSAHVLQARGAGRPRSHLYLAMEYVEGVTLAQWMRDRTAPKVEEVRAIIEQVARGLQAFHRMEMIHRDLRPENVMIDRSGTAKIIDFGSVRVAGLAESVTQEQVLGTLQYTAPECLLGDPAGEQADLYSLGVLAYQMLSGRLPYGAQFASLRTRADQRRLRYASVLDDGRALPRWLDTVLAKAVHPLPEKRYEALSEFLYELSHPPAGRTRIPLAGRQPVRFWQALALVLVLVLIVVLQSWLLASGSHFPAAAAQAAAHSTSRDKSP